jgi:branched-chain amino acid transport system permease protein
MSDARIETATRASRIGGAGTIVVVLALAAAPAFADGATLNLLTQIYAYLALATLWNLLAGFSGLVSVGQHAWVGLGGYGLFAATMFAGVHPIVAIALSGLAAAALAVPVAGLLFRLRGSYFAIGSWVVAEVMRLLTSQVSALGGGSGASLPARIVVAMAPGRQAREFMVYWTALVLVAAIVGLTLWLLRSGWGLALRATHDDEIAARSSGVEVGRARLFVYALAAAGAAMVGALIFLQKLRISPDAAFSVNDWTAFVIFITVIGGIGRLEGPVVGVVVFFLLRQTLADLGAIYLMMLGLVAIVVMLKAPQGLWGLFADRWGLEIAPLRRRVVYAETGGGAATSKEPSS